MKLNDIVSETAQSRSEEIKEIQRWLDYHKSDVESPMINPDLTISVGGSLHVVNRGGFISLNDKKSSTGKTYRAVELVHDFKSVTKDMIVDQDATPHNFNGFPDRVGMDLIFKTAYNRPGKIKSFAGSPRHIGSLFKIQFCKIKTFAGAPDYVRFLDVRGNPIKSLIGVHQHIKHLEELLIDPVQDGGLGLLLIPEFRKISYGSIRVRIAQNQVDPVLQKRCLWAYQLLSTQAAGKRDILACQEQLIDNDLEEFAQL